MTNIVWHYTPCVGFAGIFDTGKIRTSKGDIPETEKPIVWFSSNPVMENSFKEIAYVRKGTNTGVKAKSIQDHRILNLGLYRLGIDISKTIPYFDLAKVARISANRRKILEQGAVICGAKPSEWFGIPRDVSLLELTKYEYFDGTAWSDIPVREPTRKSLFEFIGEEQERTGLLLNEILDSSRSDPLPTNGRGYSSLSAAYESEYANG